MFWFVLVFVERLKEESLWAAWRERRHAFIVVCFEGRQREAWRQRKTMHEHTVIPARTCYLVDRLQAFPMREP